MAIYYISVWQAAPNQSQLVWEANVLAPSIEEGDRIGRSRFAIEHPELDVQDFTVIATGDNVEKSITV